VIGYFSLVLHSHLPYVHHPEHDSFLEERWFFEAVIESYIPLLMTFDRLAQDGISFKVTISLTPPLLEMMKTKSLQEKFLTHVTQLIELCDKEIVHARTPEEKELALFYKNRFTQVLEYYKSLNCDLTSGFKKHSLDGNIELITCNATHGFLPLMQHQPVAVNSQIKLGVRAFQEVFGFPPKGMWLAECGYYPGLDEILKRHELRFFFVDSHALWYADEKPKYDVYRPVMTPSGVFAFSRDPESSEQVWSASTGYPGDYRYREFYRDIGFDRDFDYIKPYIDPSGARVNTGIKYYKITSKELPLDGKSFYNRDDALTAAKEHALDFLDKKLTQIQRLYELFDQPPVVVAPFDTELFGHWWFEGPEFLEYFFREAAKVRSMKPLTASEVLEKFDSFQILTPAASSWGNGGYNETWLNGRNDWIYIHMNELSDRMEKLASEFKDEHDLLKIRVLNQMLRELLLVQSSDWAFIITTNTSVEYAVNRIKTHVKRFLDLERQFLSNNIDEEYLSQIEQMDAIFPWIDYRVYSR
jgi:1,4-alpha-glucan branching enzyme